MFKLQRGFTLMEVLITVSIVAIGLALAIPSYNSAAQKRNLVGAAEQLSWFMQQGRSESIKQNQPLTIAFDRTGNTEWCIGMSLTATACDCTGTDNTKLCTLDTATTDDTVIRVLDDTISPYVEMSSAAVKGTASNKFDVTFDPVRGLLDDHTEYTEFNFDSANDKFQLRVELSLTGRVSVCNPVSSKKVAGFDNC